MHIPWRFDLSMEKDREFKKQQAIKTAEKLNDRILHFLKNIDKISYLKDSDKTEIKHRLLKNL